MQMHKHATRHRSRQATDDQVTEAPGAVEKRNDQPEANEAKDGDVKKIRTRSRGNLKDIKAKENRMREPQVDCKLSWRSRGTIRLQDIVVVRVAAQTYNKSNNDGTFLTSVRSPLPQEDLKASTRVSTVYYY